MADIRLLNTCQSAARWFRKTGTAIAARMPMTRMTTSSSMRVKPDSLSWCFLRVAAMENIILRKSRNAQYVYRFLEMRVYCVWHDASDTMPLSLRKNLYTPGLFALAISMQ